ncbi:MAG: hypothetical protein IJR87_10145 [Bacteroidaceae bacterium]|nr:hypothetical protein [Bacteroidaceae bacterium]
MNKDYDDREFQLWNDIQSLKDSEKAEFRRKQHEKERKRRAKDEWFDTWVGWFVKGIAAILGAVGTAAITYFVERWLSEHMK